jgi:hypothetical protein
MIGCQLIFPMIRAALFQKPRGFVYRKWREIKVWIQPFQRSKIPKSDGF